MVMGGRQGGRWEVGREGERERETRCGCTIPTARSGSAKISICNTGRGGGESV